MAEYTFEGFDHTQYRNEVEERWGQDTYSRGDFWWSSMTADEQTAWRQRQRALTSDWAHAAEAGIEPASDEAQALAARQFEWLRGIPGVPGADSTGPPKEYFVALGDLYVADDRFAAKYGGQTGAEFVRDAMKVYADRNLSG
ncbi:TipAS antibiotic-recognition domain-containing protein [Leifsonia sp. A12D58]|uniref:TipAS antibiotic-recognition domain-containing protein n=1 Tax=Leifsonia sp. A12D58 TaxID=3397674 RepID=UPI0039E17037